MIILQNTANTFFLRSLLFGLSAKQVKQYVACFVLVFLSLALGACGGGGSSSSGGGDTADDISNAPTNASGNAADAAVTVSNINLSSNSVKQGQNFVADFTVDETADGVTSIRYKLTSADENDTTIYLSGELNITSGDYHLELDTSSLAAQVYVLTVTATDNGDTDASEATVTVELTVEEFIALAITSNSVPASVVIGDMLDGQFTIEGEGQITCNYELTDGSYYATANLTLVTSTNVNSNTCAYSIDTSSLNAGSYSLTLNAANESETDAVSKNLDIVAANNAPTGQDVTSDAMGQRSYSLVLTPYLVDADGDDVTTEIYAYSNLGTSDLIFSEVSIVENILYVEVSGGTGEAFIDYKVSDGKDESQLYRIVVQDLDGF